MDEELPEEAIETAEESPSAHDHDDVQTTDMAHHLTEEHGLEAPEHLSESTLDGLHDRLHHEADAIDDPAEE
jgi:hypothetical protein